MRRILLSVLLLLFSNSVTFAADSEQEFVRNVNRAIENGKKYLIQQQAGKDNWEGVLLETLGDQVGGQTALATLALLYCGMSQEDKVIQRSLDYLRSLEPRKTYVVGLTTMVLAEARRDADLDRIQRNAEWLLETAIKRGGKISGWSYPMTQNPDGSNTQYALLGLYAAKQRGIKIDDKYWEQLRELYSTTIHLDGPTAGYWTYDYTSRFASGSGPSFTMTVAGVCGLLIAGMGLNESKQQLDEPSGIAANCGVYQQTGPVARGMNYIAGKFAFGLNGERDSRPPGWKSGYYNIYGIERLGRISGQRFIGKYDWYREGCEALVKAQKDKGQWSGFGLADQSPVIATSFALMFLSKGRTPIILTKLAYGDAAIGDNGILVERGEQNGIVGWNRKQNDARNITEFVSRELFNGIPLGWQVYDTRRVSLAGDRLKDEVENLLACPVLYMNGHKRPLLSGEQKELLKKYVDEGGFLFAEACCGSPEFIAGFRDLMSELFNENQLRPMPPEHPIWRSFFQVSPADFKGVEVLDRGCKTVVVLTTTPMAGYWEENRYQVKKGVPAKNRGERAYQFVGNIMAYATGMQTPEQKGTRIKVLDGKVDATPPRGAFKPVQIKIPGETAPAPVAMRNLLVTLKDSINLEAANDRKELPPGDPELIKYKFIYMHGRKAFTLNDGEIDNIKMNLETGGLLFADAACGKPEFNRAFREMIQKMYPNQKLELIPPEDELYSDKINGRGGEIRQVKRREKSSGSGPDGGFKSLPPALEGIKIDGRWVVIYSPYDIGCSLERRVSTDCLGHTAESATQLATAVVLYSLKR